jgi:hypothetical protein
MKDLSRVPNPCKPLNWATLHLPFFVFVYRWTLRRSWPIFGVMHRSRLNFYVGLMFCWLSACGYASRKGEVVLGGTTKPGPQKLFIPIVDNLTVRTGFEVTLTNALRKSLSTVRGLELVESSDSADYFLLGTLTKHRLEARSAILGTNLTQGRGGIAENQSTAADLSLTLDLRVQLVERSAEGSFRRELWTRDFSRSAVVEASTRHDVGLNSLSSASYSAPHINASREEIQVRLLSEQLAQLVLDQVVQDF